ncbi:hypothetical protein GTY88_46555 [Streptomyces sp. SID5926]|nr:hypothetical protein [Streptomyces sp. SID5926]
MSRTNSGSVWPQLANRREGGCVRQGWEPDGLIEVWTLIEDDMKKVRNKSG